MEISSSFSLLISVPLFYFCNNQRRMSDEDSDSEFEPTFKGRLATLSSSDMEKVLSKKMSNALETESDGNSAHVVTLICDCNKTHLDHDPECWIELGDGEQCFLVLCTLPFGASEAHRLCVWSSEDTGHVLCMNSTVSGAVLWEQIEDSLFCTYYDENDTLFGFKFNTVEEAEGNTSLY